MRLSLHMFNVQSCLPKYNERFLKLKLGGGGDGHLDEDVDVSDFLDLMQQANDAIGNMFHLTVLSNVEEAMNAGCAVVI